MGGLIRDLRYGFRVVVARPVFTVAVVVTLALGIGLNAATFSAVHGILLRPLDGAREPERLVQIYRSWAGIEYGSVSVPHYQDVRDRSSEVFESTAAWSFNSLSLSSGDRSERLLGLLVSANFFQTYGVAPALGRVFIPGVESVGPGAHPVAVLGYSFWSSRFGGDPSVVGRTVILNGHPFEIVGVAAEGFGGPMSVVDVPVYVPLMMQAQIVPGFDVLESRGNNFMSAVGRLRPGASIDQAQAFMDAMLLQLRDEYPDDYDRQLGTALVLQTDAGIHPSFGSAQRGMSAVMLAVVGVLLLIACVNVANLFLVRARERRREMGIRLSLGAGTGRIVRQLLTESLLFSLLGGAAGLGLAYVVVTLLARIRPPIDGPWRFNVDLDGTVLLFTLGITVVAGVLFGLAPALQAASPDTVSAIKGDADGPRRSRISRALILAQISLSIVLLISSGLFLRSLQGATRIDPGFRDPATIVTAGVDPALQGYDRARIREFFDRLVEEVARIPGVTAVGLSNDLPLDFSNSSRGVEIAGYDFAEDEQKSLGFSVVS
ncbi:MAG: ABC transporter permease, partial [Gemmatimonadota bacterium]|nr:ABC transporter permease [Gemmatimonadota bacterium]